MSPRPRSSYREAEVHRLIQHYPRLLQTVDTTPRGLRVLVLVADLNWAMARLSDPKYRDVVLLYGVLGWTQEETADALQISRQAVSKRFRYAVEELVYLLNGENY